MSERKVYDTRPLNQSRADGVQSVFTDPCPIRPAEPPAAALDDVTMPTGPTVTGALENAARRSLTGAPT
jgi:hypothetical protein